MKKFWLLAFLILLSFAKIYSQVQETKRYTVELYPLKDKELNFRLQVTRNFGDVFSVLFSGGTKLSAIDSNSYRIQTNASNHIRLILDDVWRRL